MNPSIISHTDLWGGLGHLTLICLIQHREKDLVESLSLKECSYFKYGHVPG